MCTFGVAFGLAQSKGKVTVRSEVLIIGGITLQTRSYQSLLAAVVLMVGLPKMVFAYIGPGSGLSAIGAFLACLVGVIVAILGFFWYPIKRLLGKKPQEPDQIE